eukprot:Blabericola_migrator_1__3714@NODE_2110_length_3257_cov_11_130094_g1336_i0_p1_GENE_NODE_2110_length_3257_cov_11_130094_g1336_i0NODE_2110_length_3257_cov_11_130094_g1336_i0_p1_ORF_typecomplete_len106_score5_33_NODE_2110_length_3257_cov_11_130094_g1336_i0479796
MNCQQLGNSRKCLLSSSIMGCCFKTRSAPNRWHPESGSSIYARLRRGLLRNNLRLVDISAASAPSRPRSTTLLREMYQIVKFYIQGGQTSSSRNEHRIAQIYIEV